MEAIKKILRPIIPLSHIGATLRSTRSWLRSYRSPFARFYPAGHFYSALPDMDEVDRRREEIFDRSRRECPGVEFDESAQLQLLDRFSEYASDWCFPEQPDGSFRYYTDNKVFVRFDAMLLFAFMRALEPERVVEIGSGFSSAVMLDTNERFLGGKARFSFIEPCPERLFSLLFERDRQMTTIQEEQVQFADLGEIELLGEGDLFFVDSSHVVKIGADVNFILFEILPRLRPGVVVHFHDVYWPFEYPEHWVNLGRAWNEAYALRAFLQYNRSFEIIFFNSYMQQFHGDRVHELFPFVAGTPGSSLWLRKTE